MILGRIISLSILMQRVVETAVPPVPTVKLIFYGFNNDNDRIANLALTL